MEWIKKLFQQRQTRLTNGDLVKEGDLCQFVNSDGETVISPIKRRLDGSLFFLNIGYEITDYPTLQKIETKK